MSRFLLIASLLFTIQAHASETEMISQVEKALGVSLKDKNEKSVKSRKGDCTVTAYLGYSLQLRVQKTISTPDGELSTKGGFETDSNLTCTVVREGSRLNFKCEGQECETQGCVDRLSMMTLENRKFTAGKAICDLDK